MSTHGTNPPTLSKMSAQWPTPIPIAAAQVAQLTDAMRCIWARVRSSEGTVVDWIRGDIWFVRAAIILYRMGLLSDNGVTDDGFAAVVCGSVPTLAESLKEGPGVGAAYLDAALVSRVAAPIGALPGRQYRIGMSIALRATELRHRPAAKRAAQWRAAARLWLRDGGVLRGHRMRAMAHLWPDAGHMLERAVMIVGAGVGKAA